MRRSLRAATSIAITCIVALAPSITAAAVYEEYQGFRSTAMGGAQRSVANSNDSLLLNPAGMSVAPRYSFEMQYGYTADDSLSHIHVSAVDSKSGPVAGGIAYTHDRGDSDGADADLHRIYLGAGYNVGKRMTFGLTSKYIIGSYRPAGHTETTSLSLYTMDAGTTLIISPSLMLAFSFQNIIGTNDRRLLPRQFGLGTSYQAGGLLAAFDVSFSNVRGGKHWDEGYHVGAEYHLGAFPIRLGYRHEPILNAAGDMVRRDMISAGLGWIAAPGALDISYRHDLENEGNWAIMSALRFFM